MQDSRNTLLALVRSALWGIPAEALPDHIDWSKVCLLAKQQTLLGLLADAVQMLPEEKRPDVRVMSQLRAYVMKNIHAHMLITNRLAQTTGLLRAEGIEPVLFKGHGLAMNYPDPMSRQCGDIDLYVGKSSYQKAVEVCVKHFGEGEHDSESLKHYHFDNQGVSVELHRIAENIPGIAANRRYQAWTIENLERSDLRHVDIEGVSVNLPPYGFDAIYVMNHAWHHFVTGGIGLRQICDWAMFIHRFHDRLDPARIESDLRSFGLLKVWHMFAWIAVNRLGLPAEECPLYEGKYAGDSEKVLDFIWIGGNFGRYDESKGVRPDGYSSGKLHSMIVQTKRYFKIIPFYPSHILKSWILYFASGIYHYFKGLF